jgi:DNA-binding response OmpR family regulator
MEGDRERCLSAGMDDYLGKPFSVEQLQSLLERWIRKEPAARMPSDNTKAAIPEADAVDPECKAAGNPLQKGIVLVAEDNSVNQQVVTNM